jgi:hypothetical protein
VFAAAQSVLLLTWLVMEDLWDDEFESTTWTQMTVSNRMRGAMPSVWVGLGSSAITEARHGNFDTAQALFDEAHSQVAWSVLVEFRAWQGRRAETRSMAQTLIREWSGERRYGSSTKLRAAGAHGARPEPRPLRRRTCAREESRAGRCPRAREQDSSRPYRSREPDR